MRKQAFSCRVYFCHTLPVIGFLLMLGGLTSCQSGWNIQNPYAEVDWDNHHRLKANFHTHTTMSDGRLNPQTVVDRYHALGYQILALTDHNEVTYPWTGFAGLEASSRSYQRLKNNQLEEEDLNYENRDPQQLGMLAIQGNELSRHHHMGSYFSDHDGTETEEESLKATAAKNGLTMFNHPGRYTNSDPDKYTIAWYVSLYNQYDHLIGMEIYNQGDRYSGDRNTYDAVLSQLMPDRPVWAYSNDDMHLGSSLGRNWNILLLPEPDESWVRTGMQEGRSYYVYAPAGHSGMTVPEIREIKVNNRKGFIEMHVTGHDSIRWISCGEVVHRGEKISLNELPEVKKYLRAEVFGPGNTILGTQPFGISKNE
jgi:hypothetical protein